MKKILIYLFLFWVGTAIAQNDKSDTRINYFKLRYNLEKKFKAEDSLKMIKIKDTIKEKDNDRWGRFNYFTWFWDSRADKNGSSDTYAETMFNFINNCNKTLQHNKFNKNANNGANQNWTALGPFNNSLGYPSTQDLGQTKCVWASSSTNTVYVGASTGGLWKSTTSGSNWTCLTENLPSFGVNDIAVHPTSSNTIYIATGKNIGGGSFFEDMDWGYGVFFTTNGGQTWNTNSMQNLTAKERIILKVLIDPVNTQIIYALSPTKVYKSTDGGYNWVNMNAPTLTNNAKYDNIKMKPDNNNNIMLFISSKNGFIYRSADGGSTWSANLTANITNFSTKFQDGLAIGFRTNSPYEFIVSLLKSYTVDIESSSNNGDSFSVLNSSYITDNSGHHFFYSGCGFNLIMSITTNNIYFGVVGLGKYNFPNNNFPQLTHWHDDIRGITAYTSGSDDIVYVANDGGIMKSTNSGSTWQDINQGMNISEYYSLGITEDNSDVLAGGRNDNGTNKTINGGSNWSYVYGGDGGTTYIDPTDENRYFFSEGKTFNNYNNINLFTLPRYNSPLVENPISKRVYISAIQNSGPGVKISDNYGANWTNYLPEEPYWLSYNGLQWHGLGVTAIGYSISDANTLYYALDYYNFDQSPWPRIFQIKKTTDGGTSVSNITANFDQSAVTAGKISGIVVHPSNANLFWVCIQSIMGDGTVKKVFQSNDGGVTWQDYSTGLNDIPCLNMIFDEANQRLLLGTDVGVYYRHLTDDSWHLMNNNQFPMVMATDMKINRITGDLYVATYGRGIWKTNLPGYCYNADSPLIINQNTTWSTAQTVCSNINVTAGTFTISNDQIMPKQATITVYNGAILIVDNCTITNANIVINSGGKIILQNNGILELNEDDSITVNGMKDMTYGEIKKMLP